MGVLRAVARGPLRKFERGAVHGRFQPLELSFRPLSIAAVQLHQTGRSSIAKHFWRKVGRADFSAIETTSALLLASSVIEPFMLAGFAFSK